MLSEQNLTVAKPRRRWFRFSLRTILIALTLCGVWLGYTMHRVRARRDAIRAIDANGGTYGVYVVGPKWLGYFIRDEKCFYDASRVSFGPHNSGYDPANPFNDDDLAGIIDHLNAFSDFRSLDLQNTNVTDNGLRFLSGIRYLELLQLDGTNVTDDCIPYLIEIKTLRQLSLLQTAITEDGFARLQMALPNCHILRTGYF